MDKKKENTIKYLEALIKRLKSADITISSVCSDTRHTRFPEVGSYLWQIGAPCKFHHVESAIHLSYHISTVNNEVIKSEQ